MKLEKEGSEKAGEGGQKSSEGQEALMSEVTSLLRSIRVQGEGPSVKAVKVRSIHHGREHTLIDGGATHCMRTKRNEEEWKSAKEVIVKLAEGEAKMKQCLDTNTLITEKEVQAIVPMSKVTEVGYVVKWDRDECRIEHAHHGKIPVEMSQGCPTVEKEWGERLMKEIEELEKRRAKLRMIMANGVVAETKYEKDVAELHAMFPMVPLRILERVPGERDWEATQLPWNRRRRRKIEKAEKIVINMCSGPDEKKWMDLEEKGMVVINIDVMLGSNILDPHVAGFIEEIIESGRVVMWLSGPPCRTVSLCRHRGGQDGGPKPVRARKGEGRFGLEGISGAMQEVADHDAAIYGSRTCGI